MSLAASWTSEAFRRPRTFAGGAPGILRAFAALWAAAILSIFAGPVAARDLTAQESFGLSASVEAFQTAVKEGNYDAMVDAVPPRIVGELARQTKVPEDHWKASFAAMMREGMEKTTILKFDMRLDKSTVTTLHDGTVFVLIPTETQVAMNEVGRIESNAATLALLEEGRWYLIRLNDKTQVNQLRLAYPAFGTVELPTASMKFLD